MVPKLGRLADTLLLSIEGRGRDATGLLAMLPNGKVYLHREVVPASRFIEKRKRMSDEVKTLLLHTRYATVGSPTDPRNAHPQINGGMAAVHNGTIYNATEIFKAFGLKRHATVDSEVIPALISHAGWEQAAAAIDLFDGGAAFAVVDEKHPTEVILARTDSYPLVYFVTDELIIWASTRQAIEDAWAMTYGGKPRGGEFVAVPEWTMVRVNGTVETTTIRVPKPKPKPKSRPWLRPVPAKPRKRGKGKKRAAVAETLRLPLPAAYHGADREAWMDEAVQDLMRWGGLSYVEAYDEVYGVEPLVDEDIDDELAEWRWA